MDYAQIENDIIINIAYAESELQMEDFILLQEGFTFGDYYKDGKFIKSEENIKKDYYREHPYKEKYDTLKAEDFREYCYINLKHTLEDFKETETPLIEYEGKTYTVDGWTRAYSEYLGDDKEIDSEIFKEKKTFAKNYIRGINASVQC